jgi:hypothetical protein
MKIFLEWYLLISILFGCYLTSLESSCFIFNPRNLWTNKWYILIAIPLVMWAIMIMMFIFYFVIGILKLTKIKE